MRKIFEDLILTEKFFVVLELFEHFVKITALSILHDDAKFVFGSLVNFLELDNVFMPDHVVQLGFEQGLLLLFRLQVADVDTFHDVKLVVLEGTLDQIDFSHGAFTKDFDFAILFLFVFGGALA